MTEDCKVFIFTNKNPIVILDCNSESSLTLNNLRFVHLGIEN